MNGGYILASALKNQFESSSELLYEDEITSGWRLFLRHYFLPKLYKKYKVVRSCPDIGTIISNSMVMSSNIHQRNMLEQAHYKILLEVDRFNILDFKPIRKIAEQGYHSAMEQLEKMDLSKHQKN